jgi:alpha-galactosidase
MTIEWRPEHRQFHLANGLVSTVLAVAADDDALLHLHIGAPLPLGYDYGHLGPPPDPQHGERVGDPVPFAYPTSGTGDFRIPALLARGPDGTTTLALRYTGHAINAGKPDLPDLPSTYVEDPAEAETLTVTLADDVTGLEVDLRWTLFRDRPAVARSATLRATSHPIRLDTVMSAVVDLPDADWVLRTLDGAWARETHVHDRPLAPGRMAIDSTRGVSSAQHHPFLALRRPSTDEAHGEVLGLSLVYSGNFLAEVEVEPFGTTRVRLGIEPTTFSWDLVPGEAFTTPEVVIAWSDNGLDGLSQAYHGLYRERLARGRWRDRPRPILLNNWEATYFDFDADRLVAIATKARDLGIELFCLDDGWYGHRDADDSSLGDWVVDRRKLPDGLDGVARRITDLGLDFGLWIEPEMVSPDSDLMRAHPEWAIGIDGRPATLDRRQRVLDMGRPDVVDHLTEALSAVFASAPIRYVKWDMNRSITEPASRVLPPERQGESAHRYVLGVYELYRRLTARFPDILFESCSSGGARADPGMLAFAPQVWTSDDTDAIERLAIQWGSSHIYPLSALGAHVSAVPNHQTGRVTPLATRAAVAMFGVFGYELDPTALTDDERAQVRGQVAFYREHRETFQRGHFHRLLDPSAPGRDHAAWMVVAPDGGEAIVGTYAIHNRPTPEVQRVRLRGLDPQAVYTVSIWPARADDPLAGAAASPRSGADLLANGLILDRDRHDAPSLGDFWARLFVLERS